MRTKDDEKRQRILEVAAPLFAQKHFHEVTLEDVADRAAVGKGTLYTYFRDKDGLYQAVLSDILERLLAEMRERLASSPDPRTQLRAVARHMMGFATDNPHLIALFQREEVRELSEHPVARGRYAQHPRKAAFVSAISATLQVAARRGEFRLGHPDIAAAAFFGMIRAVILHAPLGLELDALADAVVDLFLHGVAAPEGRP